MNGLTWIGQLHDGRVILETEPLPDDVKALTPGTRWKHAWKCEVRDRKRLCGAPAGVTCRCHEILVLP